MLWKTKSIDKYKLIIWFIFLFLVQVKFAQGIAAENDAKEQLNLHLEKFCFRCHDTNEAYAGLDLESLITDQPLIRNRIQWDHVIERLTLNDMPPEGELQPTQTERTRIVEVLSQVLNQFDYSTIQNPGFEPIRRLTNLEYNNTIRDLFGIDLKPAARFPSELTGISSFENSANTLFLQPALMERYIRAAGRVVDLALPQSPKSVDHHRARKQIFIVEPSSNISKKKAAGQILNHFLLRSYRRPPSTEELNRVKHQFDQASQSGQSFDEAIKQVLRSVLISPKFLLRIEVGQKGIDAYQINDWELATRLSYFLWSSMPDDELFDVAAEGILSQPKVLKSQIERMLSDRKADTLGDVFAAQWLGFRFIGSRVRLDPIEVPWCTDSLMDAMRAESTMFFLSLLRSNRPIGELVTADYTFMNEELAGVIYRRNDIKGKHMRRVKLNNPSRGGILTHPSLMAVTSNYTETSPIKRGNWILETVLGKPVPPPPPNAGALKEEIAENSDLTFREKLQLHSSKPSCRSCHSKIDPLGFSLENLDFFGRWRDNYRVHVFESDAEELLEKIYELRTLDGLEFEKLINNLEKTEENVEILKRLRWIRHLTEDELEKEVFENLDSLEREEFLEVFWHLGYEEPDKEELLYLIFKLRQIDDIEMKKRIENLEVDPAEKDEIVKGLHWVRMLDDDEVEDEIFEVLDREEQKKVSEILWELGLGEYKEENEEREKSEVQEENEVDSFDLKPIDTHAVLPDGTTFHGPSGLKQILIEKYHGDLVHQTVSKMMIYALGRQLEYYDEPAIHRIKEELKADDFRFHTLLRGVISSYPFQYKKNPQ